MNVGVPRSSWARDLAAGEAYAVKDLGGALRCWHDNVLAPHWPSLQRAVATELSQRAWQLSTRGAEATLNTLHPTIRWRDGILEVDSLVTADVDLAGRRLRLVPSAVWTRPVSALEWEQPSLTYPVADETDGLNAQGDQATRRLGREVRHGLTELGHRLVAGSPPRSQMERRDRLSVSSPEAPDTRADPPTDG